MGRGHRVAAAQAKAKKQATGLSAMKPSYSDVHGTAMILSVDDEEGERAGGSATGRQQRRARGRQTPVVLVHNPLR
jgi:hypothetical protein